MEKKNKENQTMFVENRNHADKSLANQQSKTNKQNKKGRLTSELTNQESSNDMLSTQEGEVEDGDFKVIFS